MRSKSYQLAFVTSVQRIQSFGSILLLQITLECTNDTINSLGRVSSSGLFSFLHHEWGRKSFRWNPLYPLDSNRFECLEDWRRTFSIRNVRSKIIIMLNEAETCETESTASVFRSGEVYKRAGKCGM